MEVSNQKNLNTGSANIQDVGSADPNNASDSVTSNNSVSYESYSKAVGREKTLKESLTAKDKELDAYRQKDLESKGQYETIVNELRTKNQGLESDLQNTKSNYILKTIDSQIEREFSKRGCINPSKARKLLSDGDYRSLEVNDHFEVNGSMLLKLADSFEKENDFLFKKEVVKVHDQAPQTKGFDGAKKVDLTKMSVSDMMEMAKKSPHLFK